MTRAFRIGRVLGIDIEIDYTWFIIFVLLAYGLASPYGPFGPRILRVPLGLRLGMSLTTAVLFFASVLLHELSHSVVAIRSGMRITGITLFIFGGVSKLSDEPQSPDIELRMAIAGPLASFLLAGIFYGLFAALHAAGGELVAAVFSVSFFWLAFMNLLLGLFNLLPGFPLDGGRVLRAGLWRRFRNLTLATRIASASGRGLGAFMIVGGVFLFIARHDAGGIWFAVIGWFLSNSATASYQQLVVRQTLSGVPVTSIMSHDVHSVAAGASLDEVIHEHVLTHRDPIYPVVQDGDLLGVLTLAGMRAVPRERRLQVTAGEIVSPLTDKERIAPDADAWDALARMSEGGEGALLVTSDGTLLGLVTRDDILRLLRTKMELGL